MLCTEYEFSCADYIHVFRLPTANLHQTSTIGRQHIISTRVACSVCVCVMNIGKCFVDREMAI